MEKLQKIMRQVAENSEQEKEIKFDENEYKQGSYVEVVVAGPGESLGIYELLSISPKEITLRPTDNKSEVTYSIENFTPRYGYEYFTLNKHKLSNVRKTSWDYLRLPADSSGLRPMWLSAYERAATLFNDVKRQGNLDADLEGEVGETLKSVQENNEGFVSLLQLEMALLSVLEERNELQDSTLLMYQLGSMEV